MALTTEQRTELKQKCLEAQAACLKLFDALDEDQSIVRLSTTFAEVIRPANEILHVLRFEAANALITGKL